MLTVLLHPSSDLRLVAQKREQKAGIVEERAVVESIDGREEGVFDHGEGRLGWDRYRAGATALAEG